MKATTIFLLASCLGLSSTLFAQDIETGQIALDINDYGRLRIYTPDLNGTKQLERASILVAETNTAVFDYRDDANTLSAPVALANPSIGDFETVMSIDNTYSGNPPNVIVDLHIYSWTNAKYGIIKYTVNNNEPSEKTYYVGLTNIPEIGGTWGLETMTYNSDKNVTFFYRAGEANYIGVKLLSHDTYSVKMMDWDDFEYSDQVRYDMTTYPTIDTSLTTGANGAIFGVNAGAFTLTPGDTTTLYYAFIYATSETELLATTDEASDKYTQAFMTKVDDDIVTIPETFELFQNYPNPFNPYTSIKFSLHKFTNISLSLYNLAGQKVTDIFSGSLNAGIHTVDFDAQNLTSGVYIYRIVAGDMMASKKMVLVK